MKVSPAIAVSILFLLASACDRRETSPLHASESAQPSPTVQLESLSPLLPNRTTHVAVDLMLGNTFWVQETDAHDVLFAIGADQIPRATQLSAANVMAALKVRGGDGHVQSIVAGADGMLYFYFLGGTGMDTVACLGQFNSRTDQIRILADTKRLMTETGFGNSLELARGQLMAGGTKVWLCIRHTDAAAFLTFEPKQLGLSKEIQLATPFEAIHAAKADEHLPLRLTRPDQQQLALAHDGQTLILLDTWGATLWRVSATTGEATALWSLVGIPKALSQPVIDRITGRILLFASPSDLISPQVEAQIGDPLVRTDYPALLILDPATRTARARQGSDIVGHPGLAIDQLRLTEITPTREKDEWVSYDAASGELLHMRIRQND